MGVGSCMTQPQLYIIADHLLMVCDFSLCKILLKELLIDLELENYFFS